MLSLAILVREITGHPDAGSTSQIHPKQIDAMVEHLFRLIFENPAVSRWVPQVRTREFGRAHCHAPFNALVFPERTSLDAIHLAVTSGSQGAARTAIAPVEDGCCTVRSTVRIVPGARHRSLRDVHRFVIGERLCADEPGTCHDVDEQQDHRNNSPSEKAANGRRYQPFIFDNFGRRRRSGNGVAALGTRYGEPAEKHILTKIMRRRAAVVTKLLPKGALLIHEPSCLEQPYRATGA